MIKCPSECGATMSMVIPATGVPCCGPPRSSSPRHRREVRGVERDRNTTTWRTVVDPAPVRKRNVRRGGAQAAALVDEYDGMQRDSNERKGTYNRGIGDSGATRRPGRDREFGATRASTGP
jgi:hypothetical protein